MNVRKTILCVDDDDFSISVLKGVFASEPYQVFYTLNPIEALYAAISSPPDLAVVDIEMPELNGIELIERFRSMDQTKALPVVIVSAHGSLALRAQANQLGVLAFLVKPVESNTLRDIVNRKLYVRPEQPAAHS